MAIGTPSALRIPIFRQTERRTPDRPCLNCGDSMPGNFCRNCGQRKVEVHVSLARMLMEALDDQFSLNSALPRTVAALMARPGHLTREYMAGRIVRYIPPFRLYLVTSVAFFVVLSLLPEVNGSMLDVGNGNLGLRQASDSAASAAARPQPPRAPAAGAQRGQALRPPPPPVPLPHRAGWLDGVKMNTGNAVLDSIGNARVEHFRRMEPRDAMRQITKEYLDHVPQMMFVMLPLFALILKFLYVGGRRFYVEHFVFALHVHAFAFLSYLIMLAVRWPPLVATLCAWMMLYVLIAMKRVYRQGWLATLFKYGFLGVAYVVMISIGAVATLFITVLTA
ncbi:DUF3667 domain-containing protein [Longimicrobium sp.]|uniref:DUF3667 domain-containing protein n=1 Tax=Longimicrobium sp. TaxID=2029185 RepID=UPI002C237B04|nr:DUF3667 domain-containing protein [Longimicrobium sp.]HSU16853.1 DUF3667 domain-containing protein [Longimicrobium sp.]